MKQFCEIVLWQLSYQRAFKKLIKIGEFLWSHFNIEDGSSMQHFQHVMLYYFKKGKNAAELQRTICAVYREGAVTDWLCQKWCAKFCAGDFSLDDSPRSGRPVEIDSDQTETLIENNHNYSMQEIADRLKISKSIKLSVKMKNVSFILQKK